MYLSSKLAMQARNCDIYSVVRNPELDIEGSAKQLGRLPQKEHLKKHRECRVLVSWTDGSELDQERRRCRLLERQD